MPSTAQTVPGPKAQVSPAAIHAQRRTLVLFFGAFLLPVLVAYFLLATGWWTDAGTVNRGELLTPPITLPPTFHEKLYTPSNNAPTNDQLATEKKPWVVLAAIDDTCTTSCKNALMLARQTRTLLGPERRRVQMTLIHTQPLDADTQLLISQSFPSLNVISVPKTHHSNVLAALRNRTRLLPHNSSAQSQLLIVDPLGNGMLLHTVIEDQKQAILQGKGFVKDLKRLLKYSRIG